MAASKRFRPTLPTWLRLAAILTTVVIPAIAVTTVDASAREGAPTAVTAASKAKPVTASAILTSGSRDGLRELQPARAAERARHATAATPQEKARASRDFVRMALALPVYVRPVPGPVTQWYGYHPGIDIAPSLGTPVGAAHAGMVTFAGWDDGYGMHVEVLQSDGWVTTYSHLSAITVRVGQLVAAAQQLGAVGSTGYSTGPHLHFEVHQPDGSRTDPAVWLRAHGVAV